MTNEERVRTYRVWCYMMQSNPKRYRVSWGNLKLMRINGVDPELCRPYPVLERKRSDGEWVWDDTMPTWRPKT